MTKNERDLQLEQQMDALIRGTLPGDEAREVFKLLASRPKYIDLLETEILMRHIIRNRLYDLDHPIAELSVEA